MVVYKITNIVNNKVYIGITTSKYGFKGRYKYSGEGIERVYKYHMYNKDTGKDYNSHLLSSIEKYGFDNFEVDEEFDTANTKEELCKKEIDYIEEYKSNDPRFGYNNTIGGEGVSSPSSLSKMKKRITYSINNVFENKYCKEQIMKYGHKGKKCIVCGIRIYRSKGKKCMCEYCYNNYGEYYLEHKKELKQILEEHKNKKIEQYMLEELTEEEKFLLDPTYEPKLKTTKEIMDAINTHCLMLLGIDLKELLSKENKTDEEIEFINACEKDDGYKAGIKSYLCSSK